MRNSFRDHPSLHPNDANQFLQPLTLGVEHAAAERRQPVVAPSRVVQFGFGPFVRVLDEFRLDQPLDRSVKRCWPQADFSLSALQHFLHDSVAVLLSTCKREHDVKPLCLEWNKGVRIDLSHMRYIYYIIYIWVKRGAAISSYGHCPSLEPPPRSRGAPALEILRGDIKEEGSVQESE